MTDLAVFVDGPLKGTTMAIPASTRRNGLAWREPLAYLPPSALYQFSDFTMFTRTVLVGSVAQPPDSEACFEVLLSDAAKKSALNGSRTA